MMNAPSIKTVTPPPPASAVDVPWWRLLNRYQWFVIIVAALGWLFDCLDQQLFNIARVPAMKELLAGPTGPAGPEVVAEVGGKTTMLLLIRWAPRSPIF